MKKLTVKELQTALEGGYLPRKMTDEELLSANLFEDCGLDSLDFEDLLCNIYVLCGLEIESDDLKRNSFFMNNPTGENLINIYDQEFKKRTTSIPWSYDRYR